ncbi:transposase [Halomonas denitrificans]|nr:transposase [Halomonas denitrificans]
MFLPPMAECIWIHCFESVGQSKVVIDHWTRHYNDERAHQSLTLCGIPNTPCLDREGYAEAWGATGRAKLL